ncbi:MAG: isoprenylcysteine carboxylmethyltransferase family protein [Candidatus Thorarchaeota archaeon]|nr:isoprenylcysteine carboxylmethyltransferase family protein [Candidatus Thorarchaeota archaeon]
MVAEDSSSLTSASLICRSPQFRVMLDFSVAGPLVSSAALMDVVLHLYLDIQKVRSRPERLLSEPRFPVSAMAIALVSISTLTAFGLVCFISLAWLFGADGALVSLLLPIADPPFIVWAGGLSLLLTGVFLHGWSRFARRRMAPDWNGHVLVESGPYSRVRHPSYLSYWLSFVALFMMLPSVVAAVLFAGLPGYYYVMLAEEDHLVMHLGEEYRAYILRTGRFLPRLRRSP